MSRHAIQERADDVVFEDRAESHFLLALDDVEERCAAGDLDVLDANVLVHGDEHSFQSAIDLRAVLESQQVIQVVEHFREHFMAILVHNSGQKNLFFVGIAGDRLGGDVVTTTSRVCGVVQADKLQWTIHAARDSGNI